MLGPNQGKLDVVKQEKARVTTDVLEISELKWMKMDAFNSDIIVIISMTVGKNLLK